MHSYPVLVLQDAISQMFVGHSYSTWFKYQIENKNESIIPTPESSHVLFLSIHSNISSLFYLRNFFIHRAPLRASM